MGHALGYLNAVAAVAAVANVIANSHVFSALAGCIRGKLVPEVHRSRAAFTVGLVMRQATLIEDGVDMTGMMMALAEGCRLQYRNARLKRRMVSALGETLFYVATQAASSAEGLPENWRVPDQAYTLLRRVLNDNDDKIATLYVLKTVENVTSISGAHAHALATNDMGLRLWTIFAHSSDSGSRRSCAWGISRICQLTPSVLQHIADKAGLAAVVGTLRDPSNRVKQPMINAFLVGFLAGSGLPRLISGLLDMPDLIENIMSIIERVPIVIRAKLYLLLAYACENDDTGMLLLRATQLRLFTMVSRDDRFEDDPPEKRGPDGTAEQRAAESDTDRYYLLNCAAVLLRVISTAVPAVLVRLETVVITVSGRKRPSGAQAKELRGVMAALPGVLSAVTCHLVRPSLYSEQFLETVASIIRHLAPVDVGDTDLADVTSTANEDLVRLMTCIAEALVQHAGYTDLHFEALLKKLLPAITVLLTSGTKETRLGCLKILLDAVAAINYHMTRGQPRARDRWRELTEGFCDDHLFSGFSEVLAEVDPIPVHAAKLLHQLVLCNPAILASAIGHGLCPQVVGLLQRQDSWVGPEAGGAPQLDSETTVQLVADMMASPSLGVLQLQQCGAAGKIAASLSAAFLTAGTAGRGLLPPLLQASFNLLQHVVPFAPIPGGAEPGGGSEEDGLNQAARRIAEPFRRVLGSVLTVSRLGSDDVALVGLQCAQLILALFPTERTRLAQPEIAAVLEDVLARGQPAQKELALAIVNAATPQKK